MLFTVLMRWLCGATARHLHQVLPESSRYQLSLRGNSRTRCYVEIRLHTEDGQGSTDIPHTATVVTREDRCVCQMLKEQRKSYPCFRHVRSFTTSPVPANPGNFRVTKTAVRDVAVRRRRVRVVWSCRRVPTRLWLSCLALFGFSPIWSLADLRLGGGRSGAPRMFSFFSTAGPNMTSFLCLAALRPKHPSSHRPVSLSCLASSGITSGNRLIWT